MSILLNNQACVGKLSQHQEMGVKDGDVVVAEMPRCAGALTYVIITPARNEAALIEQTIQSVIAQTCKPIKWVIVSDGSVDGTDEIVNKYVADHRWIELVRMPERPERHFAGKVNAFNAGRTRLGGLAYDIIGNLDADITFDEHYFEFLVSKFAEDPMLGVAGTPFRDESIQYNYRFVSTEHVSGACQLFRRECFESIGGYAPMQSGGVDLRAVLTARMKGWRTRAFLEKYSIHHRCLGSAKHDTLRGALVGGRVDYLLGCDPTWQFFRSLYRMATLRPFLLNGILCFAGFACAAFVRMEKTVPPDVVRFRRGEERRRLREIAAKFLPSGLRRSGRGSENNLGQ